MDELARDNAAAGRGAFARHRQASSPGCRARAPARALLPAPLMNNLPRGGTRDRQATATAGARAGGVRRRRLPRDLGSTGFAAVDANGAGGGLRRDPERTVRLGPHRGGHRRGAGGDTVRRGGPGQRLPHTRDRRQRRQVRLGWRGRRRAQRHGGGALRGAAKRRAGVRWASAATCAARARRPTTRST